MKSRTFEFCLFFVWEGWFFFFVNSMAVIMMTMMMTTIRILREAHINTGWSRNDQTWRLLAIGFATINQQIDECWIFLEETLNPLCSYTPPLLCLFKMGRNEITRKICIIRTKIFMVSHKPMKRENALVKISAKTLTGILAGRCLQNDQPGDERNGGFRNLIASFKTTIAFSHLHFDQSSSFIKN